MEAFAGIVFVIFIAATIINAIGGAVDSLGEAKRELFGDSSDGDGPSGRSSRYGDGAGGQSGRFEDGF